MNTKEGLTKSIWAGLISALVISMVGFGVMLILWLNESRTYMGSYGFLYWRSATWGDGLCLPLLVGSLIAYKKILGKIDRKAKTISIAIGIFFGLVGALIQASWLYSDTTNLNWTIPQTHYFNFAGWYHAVYFVIMFFIISTLLVQVFFARKTNSAIPSKESDSRILLVKTIIWFSGLGYVFLHNLDDYFTKSNYMLVSFITLAGFILFALLFSAFSKRRQKGKEFWVNDFLPIFVGSFSAMGFGLLVYLGFSSYSTPIICTLFAAAFVYPESEKVSKTMAYFILIAIPTFFLTSVVTGLEGIWIYVFAALSPIILLVASQLMYMFYKEKTKSRILLTLIGLSAVIIVLATSIAGLYFSADSKEIGLLLQYTVSTILAFVLSSHIKVTFSHVLDVEKDKEKNPALSVNLDRATFISYFLIGSVSLGVLLYLLVALRSFLEYSQIPLNMPVINSAILPYAVIVLTALTLLIILGQRKAKTKSIFLKIISLFLVFIIYSALSISLFITMSSSFVDLFSIWNIGAFVLLFLVSIFVSAGFISNTIKIPNSTIISESFKAYPVAMRVLLLIGSFAVLAISYCSPSISISSASPSWEHFISCIFITIFALVILPVIIVRVFDREVISDKQSGRASSAAGVGQDGMLMTFVAITGILSPLFIVGASKSSWQLSLLSAIPIIANMHFPLTYCMANNATQMKEQKAKYEWDKDKQDSLVQLSKHTRRQSMLIFFCLLPWSLVPFIIVYTRIFMHHLSNEAKKEITENSAPRQSIASLAVLSWHELLDTYLPAKYKQHEEGKTPLTETGKENQSFSEGA